jgi:hypothetical protein
MGEDEVDLPSLEQAIRDELAGIEGHLKNLPSRKDVDIHDELAEHRQLIQATGGPPVDPETHPVAVSSKIAALNEEVFVMEHSLSRERLRRKDVEARLEKAEKACAENHEDMQKFHEMYGTRVDTWLQTTPKWIRAIYYPVRVLFASSAATAAFNFPTALLATAFDWTSFSKLLWFGAIAGLVGFFVFGALSKLTEPAWAKKKKNPGDKSSDRLQTF